MRNSQWLPVLLFAVCMTVPAKAETNISGTISMSGAWALYPMTVRWGEEFHKLYPGVRIDISAGGAGKGMTDALAGAVDIGLVSRDVTAAETNKGALSIAVTKDAVIPMVNAKNPALPLLQKQGVKQDVFAGIWIRQDVTTWGQIAASELKAPVRVYTRSDACGAAETWARYLGKKSEDLKGVGVYGDPGLGEAVRKDVLAVGYNNINFAYDAKTGKPVTGLAALPLDVNGDGKIDKDEDVYATRTELLKAIAENRFPSPPARDLFFVLKGKPQRPVLTAFLRWVLTDGQKFVDESGYIQLAPDHLARQLDQIKQ
jgi:phosphate transport system substrate-binding protein